MAPFLHEAEVPADGQDYKYVRVGIKIAWNTIDWQHVEIARQHRIGKPVGNRQRVDDAGKIIHTPEGYQIVPGSGSCDTGGDFTKQEELTVQLITQITGEPAENIY